MNCTKCGDTINKKKTPYCKTWRGFHHLKCGIVNKPDLKQAVVEAAIIWADATVSTQYEAENAFWKTLTDYRNSLLP